MLSLTTNDGAVLTLQGWLTTTSWQRLCVPQWATRMEVGLCERFRSGRNLNRFQWRKQHIEIYSTLLTHRVQCAYLNMISSDEVAELTTYGRRKNACCMQRAIKSNS